MFSGKFQFSFFSFKKHENVEGGNSRTLTETEVLIQLHVIITLTGCSGTKDLTYLTA